MNPYPKARQLNQKRSKPKRKKRSGGIKITAADRFFSLCVRERANWTCERCGRKFVTAFTDAGFPSAPGLDCHHYIRRGHWAVRFHPKVAAAVCYGCHAYWHQNPDLEKEWWDKHIGEEGIKELRQLDGDKELARKIHRAEADGFLAAFYEREWRRMDTLRQKPSNRNRRLEFVNAADVKR